ncbi:hypothetical protein BJX63DRAFT_416134, partial [Aspergillus granulosus]
MGTYSWKLSLLSKVIPAYVLPAWGGEMPFGDVPAISMSAPVTFSLFLLLWKRNPIGWKLPEPISWHAFLPRDPSSPWGWV